jgi:hypothetical protein
MINKENPMNRMMTIGFLTLICFSLALTAQDVSYNYDQAADFSKFKSFKWVEIKGSTHPDQLADQQIRSALETEMAKKGLSKTDSDQANLYIAYQLAIGQEKQINAYNTGGAGWGYGARWGGGMSTATTSTINVGTLVLDMYDPGAKQLVWRGTASKTLDATAKPEKRQKTLAKVAQKMLKNYPPMVKK